MGRRTYVPRGWRRMPTSPARCPTVGRSPGRAGRALATLRCGARATATPRRRPARHESEVDAQLSLPTFGTSPGPSICASTCGPWAKRAQHQLRARIFSGRLDRPGLKLHFEFHPCAPGLPEKAHTHDASEAIHADRSAPGEAAANKRFMMLLKLKALVGSLLHAVAATLRALANVVDNIGSAISPK